MKKFRHGEEEIRERIPFAEWINSPLSMVRALPMEAHLKALVESRNPE